MTPVDVVVVSYNRRNLLLRCCESIGALGAEAGMVIVDNASTDGSVEALRQHFAGVRVIEMNSNVGFAAAVNRGIRAGSAPLVLLLNSDATLDAASLVLLRQTLEADARSGAAGPMIRGADGELELSVGRTMTVLNELGFLLAGWLHRHGHGPITPMLERLYARPRRVRSLTAACLLVRREALESVAGLDETFFLYAEDVDLCRRLRAAGWRLRYVPGARAQHLRGASGQVDPGATAAAYRRSQLAFYRKHHGRLQRALLRIWLLGRYGTALLISRGKRRDRYRRLLALVRDTDRHRDA